MRILLLISLLYLAAPVLASNYYFSASIGDDTRSAATAQNSATPWKTLQKLNQVFNILQAGDFVLFRRGDFFEGSIAATRQGSAGLPIVFGAYGSGTKPVITGLATLKNWTSLGNGVWETNLPSSSMVNMLLLNDAVKEISRYPNANAANKGYLAFESSSGNNQITDNQLSGSPNWKDGNVVIRKNRWVLDRNFITGHSGSTIQFNSESGNPPSPGYGYFIQNHPSALDVPGEWYFKTASQKLGLYLPAGDPSSAKVQVATVNTLVLAIGLSNLVFENLDFKGANGSAFDLNGCGNITVRNCDITYSGVNAISGSSLSFLTVENCRILYTNNNGLDLRNCSNTTVRNNNIRCTGIFAGMGKGDSGSYEAIMMDGNNHVVEFNHIDSTGYIPITFRGNTNLIRNNVITNYNFIKDDGGGIYTWNNIAGAPATYGSKVSANIILNGIGAGEGTEHPDYLAANGIYMDDNTAGVEITGNTVANCGLNGIYIHNGHELTVEKNTIFNNRTQLVLAQDNFAPGSPIRNLQLFNNVLFSKENNQVVSQLYTQHNDISNFGTFDNNYYCRPTYDNFVINTNYVNNGSYVNKSFDLETWKAAFGKDASSKRSPVGIPSSDLILFEYNSSVTSKTIALTGSYLDAGGKAFSGSVTIEPFSSIVLIRQNSVASLCPSTGLIGLELWENAAGGNITDIPVQATPSVKSQLNGSFEIFNAGDTYGSRLRGLLCPPQTGNYTFWIAGDDVAELWLSSSNNPAAKTRIANVTAWTNFRDFEKSASQRSAQVFLTAGQRYYIEALQKEGNGGDHVSVAWQLPDGVREAPIPASRVSLFGELANQTINFPAINPVVYGAAPFQLTATATSGLPVSFRVVSGPASLNGTQLSVTGVGEITIEATQAGNNSYSAAAASFRSFVSSSASPGTCSAAGTILREQWNNLWGNTLANVPFQSAPSATQQITFFEGFVNNADHYASRMRGYICPPVSGNYTFWISGDDAAELYLSTSDDAAAKTRIAYLLSWTSPREWTKYPSQRSAPVFLQSGQRYYIEALHKEGEGGDHLSVAWQMPGGAFEAPITGNRLSPFIAAVSQVAQSINFPQLGGLDFGTQVTLSATATSGLPVSFRVISGPATINGNQLSFSGTGIVTIEASQPGNNAFLPAAAISQSLTVAKGSQSISFLPIPNQQISSGQLTLSATSSSGLPVVFRVVSGPASLKSGTLSFTGTGAVSIEGTQPGDVNYAAAPAVLQTFAIVGGETAPICSATGTISYELWNNVYGTSLGDLSFLNGTPATSVIAAFESHTNLAENYASRIRGFICPPQTGNYSFWIAGDDAAELWLSTDDNPANKTKIAWLTNWTHPREWTKYPSQRSALITLQAGKKYYIEALHKEGSGGDHLSVAWQLPNGSFEAPMAGNRLAPYVITSTAECSNTGGALREQWNGLPGNNVSPADFVTAPASAVVVQSFESGGNAGDRYASRIRGYVCPPQSGNYTFWIAGDDAAELWISSDDNPANKVKIAYHLSWTNAREWSKFSTQQSAAVALQKGKLYFIEAVHKEGEGGDHLSVAWRLPGDVVEAPIPGNRLVSYQPPVAQQQFTEVVALQTEAPSPKIHFSHAGLQVYPSPADAFANITATVNTSGKVDVTVYDQSGRTIHKLYQGSLEAGSPLNLKFDTGNLAPGIYIVRLSSRNLDTSEKLIVIH